MHLTDDNIFRVTESVWTLILGLELQRSGPPEPDRGTERTLLGSVQIAGAWEGAGQVQCPASLARRAAATMFGVAPEAVERDQIQDALGELANMIVGNLKAFLPQPSRLSLPTVVDGVGYTVRIPGSSREVARVTMRSGGEPLVVVVHTRSTPHRATPLERAARS